MGTFNIDEPLGLAFVFERYVFLGLAFGGTRSRKDGKDTAMIGWMMFSLLFIVRVSPLPGLRTVTSLVS